MTLIVALIACATYEAPVPDTLVLSNCQFATLKADVRYVDCQVVATTRSPRWLFIPQVPDAYDATPEHMTADSPVQPCWPPSDGDMACYTVGGPVSSFRLMRTSAGVSTGTVHAEHRSNGNASNIPVWISSESRFLANDPPTYLDAIGLTYAQLEIPLGTDELGN